MLSTRLFARPRHEVQRIRGRDVACEDRPHERSRVTRALRRVEHLHDRRAPASKLAQYHRPIIQIEIGYWPLERPPPEPFVPMNLIKIKTKRPAQGKADRPGGSDGHRLAGRFVHAVDSLSQKRLQRAKRRTLDGPRS